MGGLYRSVPQIHPPSRISPPCIFSAKFCGGIFYPAYKPPPSSSRRNSYKVSIKVCTVEWQRKNEASIHRTANYRPQFYLSHSAVYCQIVNRKRGPPAATMDTPANLWKGLASSPLNAEARQPTVSVGSISPPHVLRSATPRA